MPTSEANTHFLLVGTNGSGKTNLLRLKLQSTLPLCGAGKPHRALVYDAKTEFVSIILGMGIKESDLKIINPFDARAWAWRVAEDMTRDRDAVALANILLPEKPNGGSGNNEFFDKAARRMLSGVAKFFMRMAPGVWTLRDLILAVQYVEFATLALNQDKQLRRNLAVLGSGDTAGNVLATIVAVIGDELETIAAYLDFHEMQGRTFSLKEWFDSNYILLMGADRESEAVLRPLNQLLFTRSAQLLMSGGSKQGNTYFELDELPALGKLEKIEEVARLGRSYNGSLTIAFQAYSDLEHLYGEKLANSLIGQCDKAAFLRAMDRKTAEWQSNQIGSMKKTWRSQSVGTSRSYGQMPLSGSHGTSETYSQQREHDPVYRPEDFTNIPKPDKNTGTGVKGYYRIGHRVFSHELSSIYLSRNMLPEANNVADFIPADEEAETLRLWDEEDIERLNIASVLQAFKGKDISNLPFADWVRLDENSLGLPALPHLAPEEESEEAE